jgi:hypothetical protein
MAKPDVYSSSIFFEVSLNEGDSTIGDPCETGEDVMFAGFDFVRGTEVSSDCAVVVLLVVAVDPLVV